MQRQLRVMATVQWQRGGEERVYKEVVVYRQEEEVKVAAGPGQG